VRVVFISQNPSDPKKPITFDPTKKHKKTHQIAPKSQGWGGEVNQNKQRLLQGKRGANWVVASLKKTGKWRSYGRRGHLSLLQEVLLGFITFFGDEGLVVAGRELNPHDHHHNHLIPRQFHNHPLMSTMVSFDTSAVLLGPRTRAVWS